ncbi:MAG: D-aminoacylase [Gemmatimonadota bacterium]
MKPNRLAGRPFHRSLSAVLLVLASCTPRGPADVVVPPSPPPVPPPVQDVPWDVLLVNGRLVDGTGNPWRYADVALSGDRIAAILPPGLADRALAREVLDVSGTVVAPGFIDLNGQGDEGLLRDGDETERRRRNEWTRFGAWLEEMEAGGVSVNVGSFIGGTTVRRYAMGLREGRPDPVELDTMRAVTRRAMEEGALGVATALIYPPGAYAGTDELVAVAREVARHGGIYISHIRSESSGLLTALAEAVEIGSRSGAPVEIYHLKAAGVDNWALQDQAIDLIDRARARGVDIQAAMYPYTAASTSLQACLPPWTSADGLLQENLRNPDTRARIIAEMSAPPEGWENWCALSTPAGAMMVGLSSANRELTGHTLAELAEMRGTPWAEAVLDLLVEEGNVGMVYFAMSEENVEELLTLPWMKFGSDSGVHDPKNATGMTHPRGYGTYPRILGRYVRDEGVLPLEEAVRKMTSAVADRVGLEARGLLREGWYADVVVFDPATIAEVATFTEPHQLSRGVRHLFVNGEGVIREGRFTGASPGRFLRGPGAREP